MSTETDLESAGTATDLIPGEPGRLTDAAGLLQSYSADLSEAAHGFASLTPANWSGQAADAFRGRFDPQPGRWLAAADAFAAAATAMSTYAGSLLLAQDDAADALNRYRRGVQARPPFLPVNGLPLPGTDDPGATDRRLAVAALDEARGRVRAVGISAHNAVRSATAGAPEQPSWWQTLAGGVWALTLAGATSSYNNVIVPAVNGVASFLVACNEDPATSLAMLGGVALTIASGAGDGVGVVLTGTGVGAVAGVPLASVSAAGVATGVGIIGVAGAKLGQDASSRNIQIVHRSDTGSGTTSNAPPPRATSITKAESPVWQKAKPWHGKTRTNGLSGSKRRYYEWDNMHGDIEVHDSNNKHLGTMDPVTGEMTKPRVPGRNIK